MRKRCVKDDKNDGEADKKLAETTAKDGKDVIYNRQQQAL